MTDSQQKKLAENKNTVNTVVAGIAGVVAGGVAVAAALVMSDKKNQKKVKDVLVDAKDKVTGYIDSIKPQPIIEKSTQKLKEVANVIEQKIEDKA